MVQRSSGIMYGALLAMPCADRTHHNLKSD